MIDTLCRLAAQQDCLSESLVTLSAILGFEAAPLHLTFFPEFWLEIAGDEVMQYVLFAQTYKTCMWYKVGGLLTNIKTKYTSELTMPGYEYIIHTRF